jgi:plasmid segregation protein ParM
LLGFILVAKELPDWNRNGILLSERSAIASIFLDVPGFASRMNNQSSPASLSIPILSVDLGRTATKAAVSRDPNDVVLIPSNVAHLNIDQVRRGRLESLSSAPLFDMWLEHQGIGYAIGQLAADFGAGLGLGQSKLEDALIKTLACVGYFNLKGDLAIVLSLPYQTQEQFEQEKEALISMLRSPHVMVYRGESIAINIKHVWVVPEGYGSLVWCEAQRENGEDPAFTQISAAIVDIGHQTTDFLMVDRFRFSRGISKSIPFGMSQFYEQVAVQIQGADSQSMILIEAVHRPSGERFYRPRGATQPTNLDEILPSLCKSFVRELSRRLIEWLPDRATTVVVGGGGGEFFWSDLQTVFQDAHLQAHLAKPSRQANALGQYLYGEVQSVVLSRSPIKA